MSHRETRNRRTNGRRAALAIILAVAFSAGTAVAETAPLWQGTVEFSLGSYHIAEPLFDTIYQPGGSIKGLGLSANLIPHLDFYLDVKVMSKNGLLSHTKEKTTFVLVPISLGLRGSYPLAFVKPFAGLGIDTYIYFENNPIGTVVNYAKGWHATGGIYLEFGKNIPLLPFVKIKYTMIKASADGRTIDLGGWEYAGGLAVGF
jgi:hypothetical protein